MTFPEDGTKLEDMNAQTSSGENMQVPADMIPDIRTDHAGESGAVSIYNAMLRYCRDEEVRDFARRHLGSEEKHLAGFGNLLRPEEKSRFVFMWKLAGRASIALLSLFGPRAIYAAVEAVEDGVDRHFGKQLDRLAGRAEHGDLRALIGEFQADERRHRDEAAEKMGTPGAGLRLIKLLVRTSSAFAVAVTRLV